MRNKFLSIFLASFLFISLSGCGVIDYYFLPKPEDTAQELSAGVQAMKDKEYFDATEFFSKLKDRYPFSPYTVKAEISLGDAYFLDKKYFDASEAYKEFAALHPGNDEIPYVLYQIGLSNFNLFSSIDRPQSNVTEALEYFYRVEEAYPDTQYAKSAKEYIVKCRRSLADHELYIADFSGVLQNSALHGSVMPTWSGTLRICRKFVSMP